MANPLFTRLQSTANRLITKYGQAGTVTRSTPPDPVYGGDPVEASYPAKVFPDKYRSDEIDGTVIRTGDVKLYISSVGLAIEPGVGDAVTCNGNTYRITNSDPNRYDGITNVVFIVQGRVAT